MKNVENLLKLNLLAHLMVHISLFIVLPSVWHQILKTDSVWIGTWLQEGPPQRQVTERMDVAQLVVSRLLEKVQTDHKPSQNTRTRPIKVYDSLRW